MSPALLGSLASLPHTSSVASHDSVPRLELPFVPEAPFFLSVDV